MKIVCFKFHQNPTINKEFDFFFKPPVDNGASIHKFPSKLFLVNI